MAEELLRKFSDRTTVKHEQDYPFVEAATYADDTKYIGGGWQSNWHFDDIAFVGDDSQASNYTFPQNDHNISLAMPYIFRFLQGEELNGTYIVDTIMKYANTTEEGRSIALRLLIHYMGDSHQPFHCGTRFTKNFTEGDKGGNSFTLKNHYSAESLHAVWDEGIYAFHESLPRPFDNSTWETLGELAANLSSQVKVTKS